MKLSELQEAAKSSLPIISDTDTGTWYETDHVKVNAWHKKMHGSDLQQAPDADMRYFVFVKKGDTLGSLDNKVVFLRNGEMSSGNSSFHYEQDAQALRDIVNATQAQSGARVWGSYIIYKGKVYFDSKFPNVLPEIAQISTGAVHEVPEDAWWTLNKLHLRYQTGADRVLVFKNTTHNPMQPWSVVTIKDGELGVINSQRKLDAITIMKLSQELAQALGLVQKVTVASHVIPKSKLHRALKAIDENPGVTRLSLYWSLLNLSKLPTHRSREDVATELVKLGLATESRHRDKLYTSDTDLHYTLTPVGKLVLARVNSGKNVAKSTFFK